MNMKELIWAKISTMALSPQGKECSSPSPYDFCNSRSDDDDYGSSRETELIGSQEQSMTSGESYEDSGNGMESSAEEEFRDENYLNSLLSRSANPSREEHTHHNKNEHENGIMRIPSGGSQNTEIMVSKIGLVDDFEGSEESTGLNNSVTCVLQDCVQERREEPVDIEKDKRIWEIPGPANEDDERGSSLGDDDDEFETGSLTRSDSRGRERESLKEQRITATRAVVDSHYRALIVHLLTEEGIETDKESWLEIVAALSWKAACLVKPDISECGMDPGAYVKVKCVATGRPADSSIVKGVVCKKNVANRRMTSSYKKPRLLLLGGALEYQRDSDPLSSINTILTQEEEHLKQTMSELAEHHPNVLLVEKTVTRFAHEWLVTKDISLVLNVKKLLLERIARCTGGQIIPSLNKVKSAVAGHCEQFRVEKYTEEHGSAGQAGKKLSKCLMFFEGCLKPLGCTILLKGANGDELKKVKHVVQLAVFAAYHVALETAFLADEGAELDQNFVYPLSSPLSLALPDAHHLNSDRVIAMIPGYSDSVQMQLHMYNSERHNNGQVLSLPASSWSEGPISPYPVLSTNGKPPSPLQTYSFPELPVGSSTIEPLESESEDRNAMYNSSITQDQKVSSVDGLLQVVSQESRKQDDFPPSPSDHQNILVSYSSSCLRKARVCEIGRLFRIKYYGNSDEPLGDFLRFKLFDPKSRCGICDEPTHAHVFCYTHRLGSLSISMQYQDQVLPGVTEQKIWMWHRCLKCPRKDGVPPMTRRVVMSKAARGLSFGKFLELSFSSHAAASRVAPCGHLLHRDCLRFFGCGNVLAYFRYAPINFYSVCLPPAKLEFYHPKFQGRLNEEVDQVTDEANRCFVDALNELNKLRAGGSEKVPAETRKHIADELEALLQKEKAEFEVMLKKVEAGKPNVDILELNLLKLALATCSTEWKRREEKLKTDPHVASISKRSMSESAVELNAALSNNAHNEGKEDSSASLIKVNSSEARSVSYPGVTRQILVHTSEGTLSKSLENPLAHTADDEVEDSHFSHGDSSQDDACNTPTHSNSDSLTNLEDNTRSDDEEKPLDMSVSSETSLAFPATEGRFSLLDEKVPKDKSTVEVNSQITLLGKSHPDINGDSSGGGNNGVVESRSQISLGSSKCSRLKEVEEDDRGSSMFSNFYRTYNSVGSLDSLSRSSPVVSSIEILGGGHVLLPVGENDIVVPIYDDEPTSIIAHALASQQYQVHLSDKYSEKEKEKLNAKEEELKDEEKEQHRDPLDVMDSISHLMITREGKYDCSDTAIKENHNSIGLDKGGSFLSVKDDTASNLLSSLDDVHVKLSFPENGILKYNVTCYYVRQFDALQKKCCPNDLEFIRSLCRCKKWGAQGGKSNVFFAKTCDDRFVVKQVTKTELESFRSFAPLYFKYLSEALNTGSPTCLAKILGIFRVSVKHGKGGKDSSMDLMVMENLFYGHHVTRIYDLKGSVRSRYNADATGQNKVLLDENLIELRQRNPLFVGNKAKRLLERAVWNDTAFLVSVDVMDYSLVVGVDEDRQELVLGIIDFIRQYTWDKHLETWVKASGILGGPKNVRPTVISPKEYKTRFRKAMTNYFLVVPDQWDTPLTPSTSGQGFVAAP